MWPHFYTLFLVVVGWAMFVGNDTGVSFGLLFKSSSSPPAGYHRCISCGITACCWLISVVCCTPLIEKLWDVRKNVVTRCPPS